MRLYARIENEKGKVDGMGGNEKLEIELTGRNQTLARIFLTQTEAGYLLETYPVAYPDQLKIDVKGHGYRLKRIEVCTFGSCPNEQTRNGVCGKHWREGIED